MLKVGEVLVTDDKVRKPRTVHEHVMADDDGLIHDGASYEVTSDLATTDADTSDLFMCGPSVVAKITRRTGDNDLRENEAQVLHMIDTHVPAASTFRHYFPRLIGSVKRGGRTCNLLTYGDGCVSVADILRAYPKGVDFRDMIWMLKRLLIGVGFLHERGHVHGGIIPAHILVHPEKHGAFLVGWSSAVPTGGSVSIMSRAAAPFYAPEIPEKREASAQTDIYMAFKVAVALLGGDLVTNALPETVPEPLRDFFRAPLERWSRSRPTDAWKLHDDLEKLLLEVVGKPTYRPFHMPTGMP